VEITVARMVAAAQLLSDRLQKLPALAWRQMPRRIHHAGHLLVTQRKPSLWQRPSLYSQPVGEAIEARRLASASV
jgi:hypothetical protein